MDHSIIYNEIKEFFQKIKKHKTAYVFLQPIEEIIQDCPRYLEICPKPIDLNHIDRKIYENSYRNIEDLKDDLDLMLENCKNFNTNPNNWIHKAALNLSDFCNNNFKKSQIKIQKYKEKIQNSYTQKVIKLREDTNNNSYSNNLLDNKQNLQIVNYGGNDDHKISKSIKALFSKVSSELNIKDSEINEIIGILLDKITKRNKPLEIIYEDTMKFINKYTTNEIIRNNFSSKFRRLLRNIKEDQNQSEMENKAFNIKIDLDENEEKREEKDKLDMIGKEITHFIDNQKMPEVFRQSTEYPMDPGLRKKILGHVLDVREKFLIGRKTLK